MLFLLFWAIEQFYEDDLFGFTAAFICPSPHLHWCTSVQNYENVNRNDSNRAIVAATVVVVAVV